MPAREFHLPTGTKVSVDDQRVRYDLPSGASYSAVSSAILNGGHQQSLTALHVLNYRVPSDYNGYDPSPQKLLSSFAAKEGLGQCSSGSSNNSKRWSFPFMLAWWASSMYLMSVLLYQYLRRRLRRSNGIVDQRGIFVDEFQEEMMLEGR
mmetsp:Transcript_22104/g.63363  ORF Transcript_22104/g.63363 Transcript_22104/m.63363 type:complete len:150 (-) Transcript_22104:3730-4179(-)